MAQKMLVFSDNRQDASLQVGHLNDMRFMITLRAGILAALKAAGEGGIEGDQIASRVVEAMSLTTADYSTSPEAKFGAGLMKQIGHFNKPCLITFMQTYNEAGDLHRQILNKPDK